MICELIFFEQATLPLMIDESSTVEDLLKLVAREMDLRDRSEQLAACSDESRSSASSDRVAATRQQPSVTSDAWRKATGVLRLLVTHEGRIERVHRADDTIDMLMSSDVRVEVHLVDAFFFFVATGCFRFNTIFQILV